MVSQIYLTNGLTNLSGYVFYWCDKSQQNRYRKKVSRQVLLSTFLGISFSCKKNDDSLESVVIRLALRKLKSDVKV